jgi:hypothetical protein
MRAVACVLQDLGLEPCFVHMPCGRNPKLACGLSVPQQLQGQQHVAAVAAAAGYMRTLHMRTLHMRTLRKPAPNMNLLLAG